MPRKCTPLTERFWSKVQKSDDPNGCWLWTGAVSTSGYGRISRGGRNGGGDYAHRISYEIHYGSVPPGYYACHKCPGGETKLCVRPTHLYAGLPVANSADMIAAGNAGRKSSVTGTQNPNATLDEDRVREIRARVAAGESKASLARSLNVGRTTISRVVRREHWSHVS